MHPQDRSSPSSDLCCVLCMRADETKITGNLACKQGIAAHQNCLIYASGIYCKNSPTFDDLFGFDVEDVKDEYKRGKKLKCSKCRHRGATAGCEVKSCKHCYHYPCAIEAHAAPVDDQDKGTFTLYCAKHNPHAGIVVQRQTKAFPSRSGIKSAETSDQDNSRVGSESDSETPRRKRKYAEFSSDSDDTQVDPAFAPIETDFEDITPLETIETTIQWEDGSRDKTKTEEVQSVECKSIQTMKFKAVAFDPGVDNDGDLGSESPSLLLTEYRHENVPFKVIEASIESVAENTSGPCSPAAHGWDKLIPEQSEAHCSNCIIEKSRTFSAPTVFVSTPSSESAIVNGDICRDVYLKIERCASRDIPTVQMNIEPPESHVKLSQDLPIDLTAPGGSNAAQGQVQEHVNQVGVSDSSAALFWRRCNDVGCTGDIFAGLTRQLCSLAESVKDGHATQHDYAVSLRILEASGMLPEIFKQMEQELEDQERQLQKKREALRDAKAALSKKLCT